MRHENLSIISPNVYSHHAHELERRPSGAYRPIVIPEAVTRVLPPNNDITKGTREVLENLWKVGVDVMQERAGSDLVRKVSENIDIKKVAFMGPPGVGKSTVIEQFIEALFENLGQSLQIKITSFDPVFQKMLKHAPREFWDHYNWRFINDSLLLTSKAKEKRQESGRRSQLRPAREIEIIETPFIGTADRGRSFVQKSWEELRERGKHASMIFVPMPEVSFKTPQRNKRQVTSRDHILEEIVAAKKIEDKLRILTKFGIDISSQIIKKSKKKIETILHTLISQLRNSANNNQREIVAKDFREEMRTLVPSFLTPYLLEHILVPTDVKSNIDEIATKRQIFYWERVFDEMGVPAQNRFIMLNPPLKRVHRKPELLEKAA